MSKATVSNGTQVLSIDDPAFLRYGKRIRHDFSLLVSWMEKESPSPAEGTVYVPSVEAMESISEYRDFLNRFYGFIPYEIGYCNGRNSSLNGLEYHKGSEIDIAVTDLVLLLGSLDQVKNESFDVGDVKAFFMKRGDAVELYGTCLHFAPCMVEDAGFKAVVVLPRGTNDPLPADFAATGDGEEKLLFAVNKWLLAHPERKPLMEKGAFPGIVGENITVRSM